VYNWPGFKPAWDGATLHNLIMRMVTRETGWEGIGRVRCSGKEKTVCISAFYTKNHHFTETGSGHTWGKHSTRGCCFLAEGLVVKRHHGNLGALRHGSDIRFPVLDSDTAFAVEFDYDGQLDARAYVQFAYLYTTTYGQRRIRVSTVAAGVSTVTGTLFRSADCEALVSFACRQACGDLLKQRGAKNGTFFLSFPSVCPELVLA
jgi:hypothetical protein